MDLSRQNPRLTPIKSYDVTLFTGIEAIAAFVEDLANSASETDEFAFT